MENNIFQAEVALLDIHPEQSKLMAHALGLSEECGEFAGKICKGHRKDETPRHADLILELGDVLWRVVALCNTLDVKIEDVMQLNIDKLKGRVKRGTLIGEGDHR